MIREYPLTGTGPGTYAYAVTKFQPPGLTLHRTMAHNDYLHFMGETGLAFIAIFLMGAIAVFSKGLKKIRNRSRLVRGTTLGVLAALTAIIFHSFFDFNLHIPANIILFTVLAAMPAVPNPNSSQN